MNTLLRHVTTRLLAGLVAILPVGGLLLTIGYVESTISSAGLTGLPFYFPGLGILLTLALIYLIGLVLTTFIGRWLWQRIDRLLHRLPALGSLYASLKQILGYGEGEDAIFQEVVLLPAQGGSGRELGLVTKRIAQSDGKSEQLVVFVPGSPNPTTGRLVFIPASEIEVTDMPVNAAFRLLVAAGRSDVPDSWS